MTQLKKFTWILAVIVLVSGILFYNYSTPYKINTTLSGVECRIGDNEYLDNVTITVNGVYYDYILNNDKFEGAISIDKYNFSCEVPLSPLIFKDGYASIRYTKITSSIKVFNLGFLYCSPDFDKILIGVGEPIGKSPQSWSEENGLYITAPANNHLQADQITKYFSSKYKWINKVNWEQNNSQKH